MELRQTDTFEKDFRKLDGGLRQRLKKALQKVFERPKLGKPLGRFKNVFSERVGHFRLVYRVKGEVLLLVCFKNRDDVYAELRKLF
jgi:mRNA-degrading endonuclease RelE of RelBE toxin-antitoxin system